MGGTTRPGAPAERLPPQVIAKLSDPEFLEGLVTSLFQPKGQMDLQRLLFQSITGPIGQPAADIYIAVTVDRAGEQ